MMPQTIWDRAMLVFWAVRAAVLNALFAVWWRRFGHVACVGCYEHVRESHAREHGWWRPSWLPVDVDDDAGWSCPERTQRQIDGERQEAMRL